MNERKYDLFTCIVCVAIGFYMFLPVMGLAYYYTTPYLVDCSSEPIAITQPEGAGQVPIPNQDIPSTETTPIDIKIIEIDNVGRVAAIADGRVIIRYGELNNSPYDFSIPVEKFSMEGPIDGNLSIMSLKLQFTNYNSDLSIQQNIDANLNYARPITMSQV